MLLFVAKCKMKVDVNDKPHILTNRKIFKTLALLKLNVKKKSDSLLYGYLQLFNKKIKSTTNYHLKSSLIFQR